MKVVLACMDPAARDVMEEALMRYEAHVKSIRTWKKGHRGSVYSFAYWLFRYSGLVQVQTSERSKD
jgi:hypothetical protein